MGKVIDFGKFRREKLIKKHNKGVLIQMGIDAELLAGESSAACIESLDPRKKAKFNFENHPIVRHHLSEGREVLHYVEKEFVLKALAQMKNRGDYDLHIEEAIYGTPEGAFTDKRGYAIFGKTK